VQTRQGESDMAQEECGVTAVTPSRDALAKVIWEASRADEGTISATGANIVADALIASGAVVPLDTLADDEALVRAVAARDHAMHADEAATSGPDDDWIETVEQVLRALAAALSERGER
jgi:hypothetical protein